SVFTRNPTRAWVAEPGTTPERSYCANNPGPSTGVADIWIVAAPSAAPSAPWSVPLETRFGSVGPVSSNVSMLRVRVAGVVSIDANASPNAVPSPIVGSRWLPSPNSFQASISTIGGSGDRSTRNRGWDSAQVIASLTSALTSPGVRVYQTRLLVI